MAVRPVGAEIELTVPAVTRRGDGFGRVLWRFIRTKPLGAAGGALRVVLVNTDLIAQRLLDILQGLPLLVLALVMSASLGPSIQNVVIAISIPIIPRAARVIRSSVLTIREMQYVEAARSMGLRHLRIAFRHI